MTLLRDTVRGALWTISAGLGSRAIGLIGTLLITHFITPADYGEVMVASVLVMTANQLSTLGLGQYIVSRPDAGPVATFHASVLHVLVGVAALAALLAFGAGLGPSLDAPGLARFLPGLAAAALFDRLAFVPERVLARDLRFGTISALRTAGDLAYTVVSVWLAALGWGALALVVGNFARSLVRFVVTVASVRRTDWLRPCRLTWAKTRELLAFGVPIAIAAVSSFASRRWDNLLVSRFFGPATTGMYNLAYNLADVPAIHVGEQLGDVLLPSFARLEAARRPKALVRSLSLLALVVFPLAVGLGAVSPTLVRAVFDARWQPIAPMLLVLAALSVTRPVSWTIAAYLQAQQHPRLLMVLELAKLALLIGAIVLVGRTDPLLTCLVVGLVYAAHMLASLALVQHTDRVPIRASLASLAPALGACVPMVLAVVAVRHTLGDGTRPAVALVTEVLGGAVVYLAAALAIARPASKDLWSRVSEALRREPRPS